MTQQLIDEAALRRSVRLLLTVADNVRRGAVPPRMLKRMVAPQVADELMHDITPGAEPGEVRTILLQQPDPLRTHFTGTIARVDATSTAYLGFITRGSEREHWQITQVLPVSERTVGLGLPYDPVGADPPIMERFHLLITAGYLDPAVELLGPIPATDQGRRHDWLDAATAVREHGEAHGLGWAVAQDLRLDLSDPPQSWTTARQIVDAYVVTYEIDTELYVDFVSRMDVIKDNEANAAIGKELEMGR